MAAVEPTMHVSDEHVAGLAENFGQFLAEFSPDGWVPEPSQATQGGSQDAGAGRSFMARNVEQMCQAGETVLYVAYDDLQAFNYDMALQIRDFYERAEPVMRRALQDYVREHHIDYLKEAHGVEKEFFVGILGLPDTERLRDLRVEKIGRLVSFSGTVTRTTEVRPELFLGAFKCGMCQTRVTGVEQLYKYTTPLICSSKSCGNKKIWTLDRDESVFVDWQRVKVQENVDEIPGGALPRTMDVILRANNCDKAKAGDRVSFCGSLVVCPDVGAMFSPQQGISVKQGPSNDSAGEGVVGVPGAGVREVSYRLMFIACSAQSACTRDGMVNIRSDNDQQTPDEVLAEFSERDAQEVQAMAQRPTIYADLTRSVCPSVYGHDAIKQAILLMLFGGVHKRTLEGTNLRGDVNLAIIGDPSCAKSQLLKYVAAFLPRAVYTSGKASTAAGLTASVVKEPENNEFAIEAGALMLADNGICCIDEFDKMDIKDQVAIHEAMEQQTISITKAGIQATLNARASILAAANPVNGRYDKSKPLKQNIQLPPAILSRFDLLHVMLDETTELMDERIAQHIVNLHRNPESVTHAVPFTTEALQRYIKYARAIKPEITEQAQAALVRAYKRLRSEDAVPGSQSAYRITVRQLEALVRLSEAMARVYCSHTVNVEHVQEATKLLQASILKIEQGDLELDGLAGAPIDDVTGEEVPDQRCEELLQEAHLPRSKQQQQQADGDTAAARKDQAEEGQEGGAAAQDGGQAAAAQPSLAGSVKISAKKLEFIKAMLLKKLQEETDRQQAAAIEREQQRQAAAGGEGSAAMDVDGEQPQQQEGDGADAAGAGGDQGAEKPGMKQQNLVDWYMEMQINRKAITTYEEGEAEYDLAFKVISHMIKREGLLVVVTAPRRQQGEGADAFRNRVWKERRLALSPSYVPE